MARIEFDGQGVPIPLIALPPFGSDTDIPTTVLTFTDNVDFSISDYRNLGFTHFEAWCVGAAGGKGGDASSKTFSAVEEIRRPVPQDVWNLWLEYLRLWSYFRSTTWDFADHSNIPGYPPDQHFTTGQLEEIMNPNHLLRFNTWKQVLLAPSDEGIGGAGGGGGLHKVTGVLADLPDLAAIVVGKAGADAPLGQTRQFGIWTPDIDAVPSDHVIGLPTVVSWADAQTNPAPGTRERFRDIANYLVAYTNSYPLPHNSFPSPLFGGDGGSSSFAGGVGKASGGKGGAPGKVWDGAKFVVNGNGGDGGIGGQTEPGGGGKGSTVVGANGADGIWHPQEGIGSGGGGGKGGSYGNFSGLVLATAGGQGAYSYADASVYGLRQFRQVWAYIAITDARPLADKTYSAAAPSGWLTTYGLQFALSLYTGNVVYTPTATTELIIPGGGGGARPVKNLKVGSRSPEYSPNGIVVLRLSRIV